MPVRRLPEKPNLQHLKYQAKDLLKGHRAHDPSVAQRIREFHPRWTKASDAEIFAAHLTLSDAQLAIAREYGFASWTRLKRRIERPKPADAVTLPHHERIEDPIFRLAVDLIDAGDVEELRDHLKKHPALAHRRVEFEGGNYFRNPSLLEFIAENPVRRRKLPNNIVGIARVILDAGVEPSAVNEVLMLVATGCVPRECGVQIPLIDLLCDRGADPSHAAEVAAVLFEMQAVDALVERGAHMTLPLAAAMGKINEVRGFLKKADPHRRHLALAVASQYGHTEIVALLLDAGEDPNRFNPVGGHSHSTPLHQAAGNGHLEVVKLLVARGARTDVKDILFGGTPAEWARHSRQQDVEAYLREIASPKNAS
ncbi:MAG TPA: ankyrin repeat domain-containing protein [Candidatus Sulfotelmatobacter sp.]|nr:ankyrin repeat domain-containing protein [Candidatus Sulfotelmatobacter sp.]